jgi:hypothetical protein
MLRGIIVFCCDNHMKHTKTLHGKIVGVSKVKSCGECKFHRVLNA